MTHGSVLGRAALFALPICAGNILQLLYSTVDTLVIGNFCDTTALASVATSSQPLEILLCVFVGIGSGISILVSQAVGRADHDQLQKLVRTSVWLLFAASLPLTVIGFLLGPWMLRLMQVPADAMPGAVLYLRITMLGILGNMGYNFNAGLLRGIGNSSSSLLLLFISCAANIILDLVLTGALGLGIGGVAAATAIALFLSWICSIFYIRRRCTELALPVLPCGFDAGALRQIVRIGLPLGLNSALYSIGHVFLQVLYNLQGSVFVAGCSVAGKEGRACWLLVNEGNTPIKTRLTLPVDAPLCRYDLWNGQPCACPAERTAKGACLPLELPARGSLLLFTCTAQESEALPLPPTYLSLAAPAFALADEDAAHLTKTYRATLQITATELQTATPLLTLPGQEMAELTVNGQPAGVSFWPPHKFPLAGLLTPGENTLTLTLTGSPANRYGKHPVPYGLDT